jgi:DNA-directed RNA polymerase
MARDLATVTDQAISRRFPRAAEARERLKRLASVLADENKPLCWSSPSGLPVLDIYFLAQERRIKLYGRDVELNIPRRTTLAVGDTDRIDKRGAKNSATANVVHSADAAHLHMVAAAADDAGIDLLTIHDCVGACASDIPRLRNILREQFVRMYKECDLLAAVFASARNDLSKLGRSKMPAPPTPGKFNIEEVLRSDYCFT